MSKTPAQQIADLKRFADKQESGAPPEMKARLVQWRNERKMFDHARLDDGAVLAFATNEAALAIAELMEAMERALEQDPPGTDGIYRVWP